METLNGIITDSVVFTATNRPSELEKIEIVRFLSDTCPNDSFCKVNIRRAVDYSIKEHHSFGGFTIVNKIENKIVSAAIINHTGMQGYVAENILVYLGVHPNFREMGFAKILLDQIKRHAKGDIAVHLSANSDMTPIFQKIGFSDAMVELRLKQ